MTEINRVRKHWEERQEQQQMNNAFRTKLGLEIVKSDGHSFKDDPTVYLRQVYEPGTWFCDIVHFGKYLNKNIGYFMFIHANSRFIVLYTGNLLELDEEDELYEFSPIGLKSTQYFMEAMNKLTNEHECKMLITDFEPGWKSLAARTFYRQNGIIHVPINVSQYGHRKLGILDRAVRTVRDMVFNTGSDQTDPVQLQKLIDVYNNTRHYTLTKFNKVPTTPSMVMNNPGLEKELVAKMRAENWNILHNPKYEIQDGTPVVVKHVYNNRFEKHRRTAMDGKWVVEAHEGIRYIVKNINTGELKTVFRSQIRAVD